MEICACIKHLPSRPFVQPKLPMAMRPVWVYRKGMTKFNAPPPDDWHLHLRDGAMLQAEGASGPAISAAPSSCQIWCRPS